MKPMIALIATGVILLLIMLYFGNTSFEGTYETNVYQNSVKYDKTAPIIKELESMITDVSFEYDETVKRTKVNFNRDEIKIKYPDSLFYEVVITYPNKPDIIEVGLYKDEPSVSYEIEGRLPAGLYNVIFNIHLNSQIGTLKVMKSVYAE